MKRVSSTDASRTGDENTRRGCGHRDSRDRPSQGFAGENAARQRDGRSGPSIATSEPFELQLDIGCCLPAPLRLFRKTSVDHMVER